MVYKDLKDRTLHDELPELQKFLKAGLSVLDVGFGRGSISVDVAQAIHPGKLVGIDIMEQTIDLATDLAQERLVSNVDFKVMDAHELNFDDNTFDLIYSYTTAHFWWAPALVMHELKRVAKPGAWVVTAGIRDYGFIPHYPDCPAYVKVWDAISASMEAYRTEIIAGTDNPQGDRVFFFRDFSAGRKCVQWYIDAGFTDLEISSRVEDWWYPGSAGKQTWFFESTHFQKEYSRDLMKRAIARGYLDRATADKAVEEIKKWEKNPHAFYFHPSITITGRA